MRWLFSLSFFVILGGGFLLFLGAEETLAHYLTSELAAKTEIRAISLGKSSISLKEATLSNPRKAKRSHAFTAKRIVIEAPWSSYFKKTMHLDTLKIESPTFAVELYNSSGSSNNWTYILRNLPHTSCKKPVIVDQLVLINVQFDAIKSNGKEIQIPPIPYLELKNLREMNTAELSRTIFQSVLNLATKEVALSKILNDVMPINKEEFVRKEPKLLIEEPGATTWLYETSQKLKTLLIDQK